VFLLVFSFGWFFGGLKVCNSVASLFLLLFRFVFLVLVCCSCVVLRFVLLSVLLVLFVCFTCFVVLVVVTFVRVLVCYLVVYGVGWCVLSITCFV